MIRHARAPFVVSFLFALLLIPTQAQGAKTLVNTLGATSAGSTGSLFNFPRGVAVNTTGEGGVPAGTFYVVDGSNNRIQRFSPTGEFVSAFGWDVTTGGDTGFEICPAAASCKAGTSGHGAGQFQGGGAQGIAVDQATGNLFVSNQLSRRISVFSANGGFQSAFGWGALEGNVAAGNELELCTALTGCAAPNTTAGTQGDKLGAAIGGLALDASGNLYVADKTNRRIVVFKLTLSAIGKALTGVSFLRAFGWGVNTGAAAFEVCTTAATCKAGAATAPGNNPGQFGASGTTSPAGLALDSAGNLYALDPANKRVQKFDTTPSPVPSPTFDASAAISQAFGGNLYDIAYDSAADRLFVSGSDAKATIADTAPGTGTLTVKAAGGNYKLTFEGKTTANIAATATAATVQSALEGLSTIGAGNVAVTGGPGNPEGTTPYTIAFQGPLAATAVSQITVDTAPLTAGLIRVAEIDPTGAAVADGTHGKDLTITAAATPGLAVAPVSAGGSIFLSSSNGGQRVFVLNAPPAATLDDVTIKTTTTATLSGTVDPTGGSLTCLFQYSKDQVNWTDVPEAGCPSLTPAGGPQAISESISGLQPGATYYVRLTATKAGVGSATTAIKSFKTDGAPPIVSDTIASKVGADSATLNANVNPLNQPTTWRFEYVEETEFQANGFANATKVPSADVPAGSGGAAVPIAEQIAGLSPSTTYRFRAVAANASSPPGGTIGAEVAFTTHSPEQDFDPCPNDAFRSGPSADLPDCRAYEQASPVDKNGGSIIGSTVSARTATDGSTITFESTTGVPGGSGSAGKTPTYLARRGEGQWSTVGLLPNPSSGQRAAVLGWTPDFATVFDRAELFTEGTSFLARDSASGTQTEIVPHTAPPNNPDYGYVDSSADGETTIFEAQPQGAASTLQLTPDAAAGKPNLYAWDGTLHLAGVLPDGTTPAEGSRAGRGMDARDYHRDTGLVAEDGSVFFNDAGSGQLYLRLNPTAEDATTVHVSASRKTNGKGPEGTDAAGPQPATFRAASADGSLVTFTSSEKLTNDANTGSEPKAPTISRAAVSEPPCAPAPCEVNLEFLKAFAGQLALDATTGHVYWSDPANGRIGRAKLDGTDFTPDYITGLGEPIGIAVVNDPSAEYIFWTDRGELNEKGEVQADKGSVGRADLDGSDVKPDCYTGLTNPRSIAASASHVYWTMPVPGAGQGQGDTGRGEVACDPLSLDEAFISGLGANGDIAVNASHLYISTLSPFGNSFVSRYDLNGAFSPMGGEPKVTGTKTPLGLALDASHLYWTDEEHNRIGRSLLDGTSQEYDFIAAAGPAEDPARGGDHLFWTANQKVDPNPGTDLYRLDRASDELIDLAPDAGSENGAEVQGVLGASADGSHVYFAANGVPDNLTVSTNANGEEAEPGDCKGEPTKASGVCNLYLWREDGSADGETIFISHLVGKPSETSDAVNWAAGGIDLIFQESERTARVSEDGRVLVFRSSLQLSEYDNQGPRCEEFSGTKVPGPCPEFYRFDYEAMDLACLSCDPRGATPQAPPRLASVRPPTTGATLPASTWGRNLSGDGDRFFFETADALVAADTNGEDGCPAWGGGFQDTFSTSCQDVYEWEAPGTGSCEEGSPAYSAANAGCIYLISTGKSEEATFFADADPDGENVFIFTYEQLVPQDEDALMDAYDARIDGGLAAQHALEPPACAGDACRPQPLAPPPSQAPGSSGFAGPTDPQPNRAKQRKRKRRKQARQRRKRAAKAKQRARQRQRAAKQSGRAGR